MNILYNQILQIFKQVTQKGFKQTQLDKNKLHFFNKYLKNKNISSNKLDEIYNNINPINITSYNLHLFFFKQKNLSEDLVFKLFYLFKNKYISIYIGPNLFKNSKIRSHELNLNYKSMHLYNIIFNTESEEELIAIYNNLIKIDKILFYQYNLHLAFVNNKNCPIFFLEKEYNLCLKNKVDITDRYMWLILINPKSPDYIKNKAKLYSILN